MTFIEAPRELQDNLVIPDDHIKVCEVAGVSYEGNAAANTEDYLNMKGENKPPGFIPEGFTVRGIVALVFSCIWAIMGMVAISIYEMSGLKFTARKLGSDDDNTSTEMEVTETSRAYRD